MLMSARIIHYEHSFEPQQFTTTKDSQTQGILELFVLSQKDRCASGELVRLVSQQMLPAHISSAFRLQAQYDKWPEQ